MRFSRLLACAFLLACAGLLQAQAAERYSRSALIIGVGQYGPSNIPWLDGVQHDIPSARAIAQAMGIPQERTTVLRDEQATKANILAALEQLSAQVADGGRVLVYFSGHGTRWNDPQSGGCQEGLMPYDGQPITNAEIAQVTRRMSELTDKLIVFFDACHSDGVADHRPTTRGIARGDFTPKFFLKNGADASACSQVANVRTRSLLGEATRLGALQENFVQITSSRADEVSFDEPGKGGLATQAVRQCLLGEARDLDGSGAISLGEIQSCAQGLIEDKFKNQSQSQVRPHHVTVTGNRNLVAVVNTPPAPVVAPASPAVVPVASALPVVAPGTPAATAAPAPTAAPTPAPAPLAGVAPAVPTLASLATLREIEAQRNPRARMEVSLNRNRLRIGQDPFELQVRSQRDGHVYVILLGSDRKSFYLLFPNGLDRANAIRSNEPLRLPRPGWSLVASGPAGTDHLLVLVSDSPRDLRTLTASPPSASSPFTFALNDLGGRASLVDFFAGRGVLGTSEAFDARILSVEEIR